MQPLSRVGLSNFRDNERAKLREVELTSAAFDPKAAVKKSNHLPSKS